MKNVNAALEAELKRLAEEKDGLTRKLEVNAAQSAMLHRMFLAGQNGAAVTLSDAAVEAMKALKRFTRGELAERVRLLHPDLEFSDASLGRPMTKALKEHMIKMVQANQGNKSQAVYELTSQ